MVFIYNADTIYRNTTIELAQDNEVLPQKKREMSQPNYSNPQNGGNQSLNLMHITKYT